MKKIKWLWLLASLLLSTIAVSLYLIFGVGFSFGGQYNCTILGFVPCTFWEYALFKLQDLSVFSLAGPLPLIIIVVFGLCIYFIGIVIKRNIVRN